MSSTSVYSIRIDSQVRMIMDEISDQNLQEEIRTLIEQLVRKKRKELLLAQARERQDLLVSEIQAAEAIREDRDTR